MTKAAIDKIAEGLRDAALMAQEAEIELAKTRIESAVDRMIERGIPPYAGEPIAITWPKTWRPTR